MSSPARAFELFKAIAANDGLRERLSAASEADRQTIIANMGFADVTAEAIEAATRQLALEPNDELSDQELEQIAGGAANPYNIYIPAAASAAVAT